MFEDEKQKEKSVKRRKMVKQSIKDNNKDIDSKSFTYFMDLVDDLSSCIDLKLGKISDIPNMDPNCLERMYLCGECLLTDTNDETTRLYLNQYIDSVVVEYAKFDYEVGLLFFKEKLKDFTQKYFGKKVDDYHDGIISLTESFQKEEKKSKKLAMHNNVNGY